LRSDWSIAETRGYSPRCAINVLASRSGLAIRVIGFSAVALMALACSRAPTGPDPSAGPLEPEYGAVARSIHADVVGRELRIATEMKRVCVPEVSVVYELDDDSLNVFLSDDIVQRCEGPPVACFELSPEFAATKYRTLVVTTSQDGYPELPIARGKKARAHGPQCP
jgi:hypothetical protein